MTQLFELKDKPLKYHYTINTSKSLEKKRDKMGVKMKNFS